MIEQTRLPTKQIGTRSLETRHMANTIHIGRGQLWGEIHWRGTRPASQKHTRGTLQTHMQLDRNRIHRDHIGLGLQQTTSAFINAKLREESLATIPTHRWQTTACQPVSVAQSASSPRAGSGSNSSAAPARFMTARRRSTWPRAISN